MIRFPEVIRLAGVIRFTGTVRFLERIRFAGTIRFRANSGLIQLPSNYQIPSYDQILRDDQILRNIIFYAAGLSAGLAQMIVFMGNIIFPDTIRFCATARSEMMIGWRRPRETLPCNKAAL